MADSYWRGQALFRVSEKGGCFASSGVGAVDSDLFPTVRLVSVRFGYDLEVCIFGTCSSVGGVLSSVLGRIGRSR